MSNIYVYVYINIFSHFRLLSLSFSPDRYNERKEKKAMATLAAAATRQAATLSRISSPKSPAQVATLIHRRGLAGAAEHHGPLRINCWQDPMSPSKWKEEHFVIVSLSGWGLMIYGGYKFFTRGKGKGEEKAVEAAH